MLSVRNYSAPPGHSSWQRTYFMRKKGVAKVHIAVFASGKGSNAEAICRAFAAHYIKVALIVCNNPAAEVLQRAKRLEIPTFLCSNDVLAQQPAHLLEVLRKYHIHFIALAGFLRLLPAEIIAAYRRRILNIHPALLPKYGGKGMYGIHVHKAVIKNKERQTGITIHEVNEAYDQGRILFQAQVPIPQHLRPSPQWLAAEVAKLEHKHYPRILAQEIAKTKL